MSHHHVTFWAAATVIAAALLVGYLRHNTTLPRRA